MAKRRRAKATVGLTEDEYTLVRQTAKIREYLNPTAFMRAAIRKEINGREEALSEAELRIAAGLERTSREILRVQRAQQALFAVVDTLVKTFLTCVPEPPREAVGQSVSRLLLIWQLQLANILVAHFVSSSCPHSGFTPHIRASGVHMTDTS